MVMEERLDYMTLQMHYQKKFEQGLEQGLEQGREQAQMDMAMKMLENNNLSLEEMALYSGLTLDQVQELKKELQPV